MSLVIKLNRQQINQLDLSPMTAVIEPLLAHGEIISKEQALTFEIDYALEPTDPRELSEIPEIRLWFIRLDSLYPWLPFILDWKKGELARYTAMLVPHEFKRSEGIQYNSEALEIFVMSKIFILANWLQQQDLSGISRLKSFAQMLGYDLDESFFTMISEQ
jgi:hypothetical protein